MGSRSNTNKAQHSFVILTFSQPSKDDQKYIIKDLCCRMQLILSLPYHTSHHCQAPTPSLGYHVDTYFLLDSIIVCHSFNEMFSWSDLSASCCWWAEHRCTSPPRRKLSAVVASFHHSLAPLLPPAVEYPPPADKISRHWLHNWLLVASIMSSTRRIGLKPPLSQLFNNDCIIWDPMIYSKYFSGL